MSEFTPLNVLFLCTHNAARSIMAEAIMNHIAGSRFVAHSAGTQPLDHHQPHPLALEALQSAGIDTDHLRSKNWAEFTRPEAPHMDLIITVCDTAAGETCPAWPGHPAIAHWSYPDPSLVEGSHAHRLEAFKQTMHRMHQRLELFKSLPLSGLDKLVLEAHAKELADKH
jgi:arsenate reductase (thioredoxin)